MLTRSKRKQEEDAVLMHREYIADLQRALNTASRNNAVAAHINYAILEKVSMDYYGGQNDELYQAVTAALGKQAQIIRENDYEWLTQEELVLKRSI